MNTRETSKMFQPHMVKQSVTSLILIKLDRVDLNLILVLVQLILRLVVKQQLIMSLNKRKNL